MRDFLHEIIIYKKELIAQKKSFYEELKKKMGKEKFSRYHLFRREISKPGRINLIAEIKKASPSRGLICDDFDVERLAKIYVDNGAAAISVLTEDKYFLGKPKYISRVSEHFSVPVLTKDFIIDEGQIYESVICGTSAILLIAAILDDAKLRHLYEVAGNLDLDCLVEVHNDRDLERVLKMNAGIIGINNRDLRTLDVDLKISEALIPQIPKDRIIVAESGIKTHDDIVRLEEAGAHAVLIGETFLQAQDIGAKIKEVMHGQS
jgi:indole-3-glycerol phosphate synthase